jgi:hypothetical protein
MAQEWKTAYEHNGDSVSVRPSGIGGGFVQIRIQGADGQVTLNHEDWRRIDAAVCEASMDTAMSRGGGAMLAGDTLGASTEPEPQAPA